MNGDPECKCLCERERVKFILYCFRKMKQVHDRCERWILESDGEGGGRHKESNNNKINNNKYNQIHKQNSSENAPKRKAGRSKTKTRTFLVVVYGVFSVFCCCCVYWWVGAVVGGVGGGVGGGEFVRFHLVQMDVWYW